MKTKKELIRIPVEDLPKRALLARLLLDKTQHLHIARVENVLMVRAFAGNCELTMKMPSKGRDFTGIATRAALTFDVKTRTIPVEVCDLPEAFFECVSQDMDPVNPERPDLVFEEIGKTRELKRALKAVLLHEEIDVAQLRGVRFEPDAVVTVDSAAMIWTPLDVGIKKAFTLPRNAVKMLARLLKVTTEVTVSRAAWSRIIQFVGPDFVLQVKTLTEHYANWRSMLLLVGLDEKGIPTDYTERFWVCWETMIAGAKLKPFLRATADAQPPEELHAQVMLQHADVKPGTTYITTKKTKGCTEIGYARILPTSAKSRGFLLEYLALAVRLFKGGDFELMQFAAVTAFKNQRAIGPCLLQNADSPARMILMPCLLDQPPKSKKRAPKIWR